MVIFRPLVAARLVDQIYVRHWPSRASPALTTNATILALPTAQERMFRAIHWLRRKMVDLHQPIRQACATIIAEKQISKTALEETFREVAELAARRNRTALPTPLAPSFEHSGRLSTDNEARLGLAVLYDIPLPGDREGWRAIGKSLRTLCGARSPTHLQALVALRGDMSTPPVNEFVRPLVTAIEITPGPTFSDLCTFRCDLWGPTDFVTIEFAKDKPGVKGVPHHKVTTSLGRRVARPTPHAPVQLSGGPEQSPQPPLAPPTRPPTARPTPPQPVPAPAPEPPPPAPAAPPEIPEPQAPPPPPPPELDGFEDLLPDTNPPHRRPPPPPPVAPPEMAKPAVPPAPPKVKPAPTPPPVEPEPAPPSVAPEPASSATPASAGDIVLRSDQTLGVLRQEVERSLRAAMGKKVTQPIVLHLDLPAPEQPRRTQAITFALLGALPHDAVGERAMVPVAFRFADGVQVTYSLFGGRQMVRISAAESNGEATWEILELEGFYLPCHNRDKDRKRPLVHVGKLHAVPNVTHLSDVLRPAIRLLARREDIADIEFALAEGWLTPLEGTVKQLLAIINTLSDELEGYDGTLSFADLAIRKKVDAQHNAAIYVFAKDTRSEGRRGEFAFDPQKMREVNLALPPPPLLIAPPRLPAGKGADLSAVSLADLAVLDENNLLGLRERPVPGTPASS